ncbi:sulfur carrier protein ThiS [Luteipulveratus halotolerans]|uniref:Thiamine biosynthesis protein ThiS n=1 Tax=Luteipulveratus halotolerans TaxID=1631356 RepID=A0A0L6CHJ5_9MICO|nr:sulfur carrier protein ThiS [Luteipulveratus halotolerans]KNX37065.1 hypothetical protein VV01_07750 [Luteipulveratus halotolerans]
MTVIVNGLEQDHSPGSTVADLLTQLGESRAGIAVALDGTVVHRESWERTPLAPGSVVEIVSPMQGG